MGLLECGCLGELGCCFLGFLGCCCCCLWLLGCCCCLGALGLLLLEWLHSHSRKFSGLCVHGHAVLRTPFHLALGQPFTGTGQRPPVQWCPPSSPGQTFSWQHRVLITFRCPCSVSPLLWCLLEVQASTGLAVGQSLLPFRISKQRATLYQEHSPHLSPGKRTPSRLCSCSICWARLLPLPFLGCHPRDLPPQTANPLSDYSSWRALGFF